MAENSTAARLRATPTIKAPPDFDPAANPILAEHYFTEDTEYTCDKLMEAIRPANSGKAESDAELLLLACRALYGVQRGTKIAADYQRRNKARFRFVPPETELLGSMDDGDEAA